MPLTWNSTLGQSHGFLLFVNNFKHCCRFLSNFLFVCFFVLFLLMEKRWKWSRVLFALHFSFFFSFWEERLADGKKGKKKGRRTGWYDRRRNYDLWSFYTTLRLCCIGTNRFNQNRFWFIWLKFPILLRFSQTCKFWSSKANWQLRFCCRQSS